MFAWVLFQTECPGGCPCDEFECDDSPITTTTIPDTTISNPQPEKAVFLLDNRTGNLPMVISFDGEVDDDIKFEFIDGVNVNRGCSATLNGQFFYFGGYDSEDRTKVNSKI